MAYFYVLLLTFLFSFGGIMIKSSGMMFSSFMISFLRFAIGVTLLLIIDLVKYKRIRISFSSGLILLGGAAKAVNYLLENYGVMKGFSYGNVIVWPVQAIAALIAGALLFHEKMHLKNVIGAILCVTGISIVSLNGADLSGLAGGQAALLPVFIGAGIGAATFTICQKMLIDRIHTVESNLSMFLIGGAICLFPAVGSADPVRGPVSMQALIAVFTLGAITGIGFLLQAEALKKIPVFVVTMIQSSSVILTLLWAVLIYHEPVTRFIVAGTCLFLCGMLLINLKIGRSRT